MKTKFRKYLPVVVDLETGGFTPISDAILEIAITLINYDGEFSVGETHRFHIDPFPGLKIHQDALEFTKINLEHPLRNAVSEQEALQSIFKIINQTRHNYECSRAILVGHNAHFDLNFLNECIKRNKLKNSPFHSFSVLDTVTLGGAMTGQTVLAKIAESLEIDYNNDLAHSAAYDAEITAKIFCELMNSLN